MSALLVAAPAVVQKAPQINGKVEGNLQMLEAPSVNLNSGAEILGSLLVPGKPTVASNGQGSFDNVIEGEGNAAPSNYTVRINSGVTLQ